MLYIQICLIGLALLAIPLFNRQRGYGSNWRLFRAVVIIVMVDLVLETTAWMIDGKTFAGANALIYVNNSLTILLQPLMGLCWLYYTFEELNLRLRRRSPLHLLCAAPILINLMLLAANYWTKSVFYISESNHYMRGDFFWINVILSFLYPAAASAIALICALRAKTTAQKQDCYVLASFILPPVIAAIIQVIWYGVFLFLIGFAISLLIVFINIQNEQITVDFLTRTNNRASMIAYFEKKVHAVRPDHTLYLLMIDVDDFKRINDTYGHIVGDSVLTTVADQLKGVCAGQKCFLSRLGGDEFGILLESESVEQTKHFVDRVERSFDEFNADSNLNDPISLSVGYAASDGENCTIDRLIQQADAMMYAQKARHRMATGTARRQ